MRHLQTCIVKGDPDSKNRPPWPKWAGHHAGTIFRSGEMANVPVLGEPSVAKQTPNQPRIMAPCTWYLISPGASLGQKLPRCDEEERQDDKARIFYIRVDAVYHHWHECLDECILSRFRWPKAATADDADGCWPAACRTARRSATLYGRRWGMVLLGTGVSPGSRIGGGVQTCGMRSP